MLDGKVEVPAGGSSRLECGLSEHAFHSPRLHRVKWSTALSKTEPCRKLNQCGPERDAWGPVDRSKPHHATSRAIAMDVAIAVSGKRLWWRVEGA
jgi:hypothetical protein